MAIKNIKIKQVFKESNTRPSSPLTAAAYRWVQRAKRSKAERDAYVSGAFDAGISRQDQQWLEEYFGLPSSY